MDTVYMHTRNFVSKEREYVNSHCYPTLLPVTYANRNYY